MMSEMEELHGQHMFLTEFADKGKGKGKGKGYCRFLISLFYEHRASTKSFHLTPDAIALICPHDFPAAIASFSTVLLQVLLGRPARRLP